jgi:hypothetical protein
MSSQSVPSAALLAANQRLQKLRAALQGEGPKRGDGLMPSGELSAPWETAVSGHPLLNSLDQLPPHLGWGSTPVTKAIRAVKVRQNTQTSSDSILPDYFQSKIIPTPEKRPLPPQKRDGSIKVYPDIALGMLRQEQAAAGRLWLLLRHLDSDGCGVIRVATIRKVLTTPKAPLRLCCWRQLRNLLRQGDGVFWHRDKERVWLRSAGRVAVALGVTQLNGRPVAVPVKHLVGSIGEARAYLYASFHAGRQLVSERRTGQKPIARDTLTELTGLTDESQRGYERRVGVRVSRNFVVGAGTTPSSKEERLWQQGGGAFEFVDHQGGQGRPGNRYIAWQLPNSYTVSLTHRPKGRQKRINRMLSDLFMKGMTGNTQRTIEKRYFGDGAGAVKAVASAKAGDKCNQDAEEVYWLQNGAGNSRLRMWYALSSSHD